MKTIKYLADGTVAKVGMRVEVDSPAYGSFSGTVSCVSDSQFLSIGLGANLWFQTLGTYVLIHPDIELKTDLFKSVGLYITDPENCTPIK